MNRIYSLTLLGLVLVSDGVAQKDDQHRWENVQSVRTGQKLEVTTIHLQTILGAYLNVSDAVIRLQTQQGEVSVIREDVFRVKLQEDKRKQNILIGVVVGALAGFVAGAIADFKDDVDSSDRGSNNGKLGGSLFGAGVGAGIGSLFGGHRVIYRAKALPQP